MMKLLVAMVAGGLVAAAPALAQPDHRRPADAGRDGRDIGQVVIDAAERALIREFFRTNPPQSYALPPGIQKRLAQGKPLPPGIARKVPDGLAGRLRHRPGYDYRVVGADVLLVDIATNVIVDIIREVAR